MREAHYRVDVFDRQQLVGDGKPREVDQGHFLFAGERLLEVRETGGVGEAGTDMVGRPHHGGMTVARGDPDHGIARLHQRQMRGHGRAGETVERSDIVLVGGAAEMLQRKALQTVEVERRADLVVGKQQVLLLHRQRMLEPREDENGLGPALANEVPGMLKLAKIVCRAGQDIAARVRQVRRVLISEAVHAHLNSPFLRPLLNLTSIEHAFGILARFRQRWLWFICIGNCTLVLTSASSARTRAGIWYQFASVRMLFLE